MAEKIIGSAASSGLREARGREVPADIADRLIVALDVRTPMEAQRIVDKLDGIVSFYKIGLWLLFADGTDRLIDGLIQNGKNVFLDYKMYDIGETVKEGVARARDRGVTFVTVHGDERIMKAAVEGKGGSDTLKIFAITVLTSLGDEDLVDMGYRLNVRDLIELRVRTALACGCDGIIASAADQPDEIRRLVKDERLLIATPGVRPAGGSLDDHKRATDPTEAIRAGADYIVMGRPIAHAPDPAAQARLVIEQMRLGLPGAS